MPFDQFNERVLLNYFTYLAAGGGTTPAAIVTAPAPGLRIDGMVAFNNDSIDHVLEIGLNAGGQSIYLGNVNVPTGAGQGGVPAVDVLAALALPVPPTILAAAASQLVARVPVALQGGAVVGVFTWGATF